MSSRLTFLARPQSPVLATGYDGNPLCSSSRPKNTVYGVGCLTRFGGNGIGKTDCSRVLGPGARFDNPS